MKKAASILCAALMLLVGVTVAKADPITTWNYTVDGIFTTWKDQGGRVGSYGVTPSGMDVSLGYQLNADGTAVSTTRVDTAGQTLSYQMLNKVAGAGSQIGYNSLRWGDSSGYSSIGLQSTTGTVTTDSNNLAEAIGVNLWHNNNPISGTVSTVVSGKVLLTLDLGLPGVLPVFGTELDFFFVETPNTGNAQSDIFIVKDPFQPSTEKFTYDGIEYTFSFGASFQALTGDYLYLAQTAVGDTAHTQALYGWTTTEGAFTKMPTYLTIHYKTLPPGDPTPTPEPTTLVLLGAGLAGLAVMARRRRA